MSPAIVGNDAHLPRLNPNYVRRIVGYTEYRSSLEYLDSLTKILTSEELRAVDEYIASRDEFSVYTNLSRAVSQQQAATDQLPQAAADDYERRGLAWITGLARIELGAMLAGFTAQKQPFLAVRPNKLDAEAYANYLLDAVRTHYLTLMQDPNVRLIAKGKSSDQLNLAYGRRILVTVAMLDALGSVAGDQFTPQQIQELKQWRQNIGAIHEEILVNILAKIAAATAADRLVYLAAYTNCPCYHELLRGSARIRRRQ